MYGKHALLNFLINISKQFQNIVIPVIPHEKQKRYFTAFRTQ
jgi:hypothetical protein